MVNLHYHINTFVGDCRIFLMNHSNKLAKSTIMYVGINITLILFLSNKVSATMPNNQWHNK